MSKVSVVGSMSCQEGKADEMEKVLVKMTECVEGQDGVISYSYHRDENDKFWFFALMENAEAMQNHADIDGMAEIMAEAMPLMAGAPEMSTCTPIAGFGFGA